MWATCVPGARGSPSDDPDPLELELYAFVSYHVVLGADPGSSARAPGALSHSAISLAPKE